MSRKLIKITIVCKKYKQTTPNNDTLIARYDSWEQKYIINKKKLDSF